MFHYIKKFFEGISLLGGLASDGEPTSEFFKLQKIRTRAKMMPRKNFHIAIFIIFLLFSVNFTPVFAQSNSIQVDLGVSGCNSNGVCDIDETVLSCPVDCVVVPPPPPPGGGGGGGGGMGIVNDIYISNLVIVPDFTKATITWDSSVGTISTLKWGETAEVKEGTLSSVIFVLKHKMEIINLKPGTMYYFVIESRDAKGNSSTFPPVYFFTKFLKDTTFPLNPRNVKATADISGITITWENPPDKNFSYVRIMRHEDRFRGNPFLGKLIYEGSEERFLDKNVVPGKKYYYTLFSRDTNGDYSSGVGVSATAYSEKEIPPVVTPPPVIPPVVPPVTPPAEIPGEEIPKVLTENFFVYQYNKLVEQLLKNKIIYIDGDQSTIVDTAAKTFPDDLINVLDKKGNIIGQFLFAFNSDSGRYQGVIPPLEKRGIYDIKIYRYKDEMPVIIGEGSVFVKESIGLEIKKPSYVFDADSYKFTILIFIILFLLFMLFLCRRRKEKEKEKNEEK